jgi:hypothetical protein
MAETTLWYTLYLMGLGPAWWWDLPRVVGC